MKTVLLIIFVLTAITCSNEAEKVQQSGGKRTPENQSIVSEQADIQNINPDSNLIREQTERTFRSISPDSAQSGNPLTPESSGNK